MAGDRTTKVTLAVEVGQYLAGMEKAAKATRETGSEAEKLAQKKEAFQLLGTTSLVMGAAIAAGVGIAIAKFAEFDQAMSEVQASTHESAENMGLLRDAAIDAGARTVFSATEAANAIDELAKAGISTADILGGALDGALDLASAGGLGVADAAGIAATALTQFGLAGSDVPHVADLLAAGAGKAMGSVQDLSQALNQGGLIAAQTGLSIEETTGTLSAFAAAGLLGSDAGTSFKSMLQRLTPQSAEARRTMDELGISAYDANGEFIGMSKFAGNLESSLKDLTTEQRNSALATIFGSDAVRAASVLYSNGAKGIAEWEAKVDDAGYAAETARLKLDNLKGDIEALGGAFDTALIQTGSAGNDVMRTMAQTLTNLVDLYNDAPEPVKAVALATGALAAAALLAGGAFFVGAPKVAQFSAALATMGPNAQKAGAALTASAGPIGVAFAAAGLALAIFAGQQAEAKAKTEAFTGTLDAQTGAVTQSTRELVKSNLAAKNSWLFVEQDSAYDAAKKLGASLDTVTNAAMGNADALQRLAPIIKAGGGDQAEAEKIAAKHGLSLIEVSQASTLVAKSVLGEASSLDEAIRVTEQKAALDSAAARKAEEHAVALDVLQGKAASTGESIDELADQIRGFGSATLSTRDAARDLEAAYDALEASVKDNGTTLDITTDKGRQNEAALDAIAKATLQSAAATVEQTGRQEDANAIIDAGRQRLLEMLGQFGITDQAAQDYANQLGLIPANVTTAVEISGAELAIQRAQRLRDTLNSIPDYKGITVDTIIGNPSLGYVQANGSVMDFYANGGMRENHVAQIAPAGAWRVWAEPETGGEAYIPLAASKRARSLDIWAETGSRLGVDGFASGAISGRDIRYERSAPQGPFGSAGVAPVSVQIIGNGVDLTDHIKVVVNGEVQKNNRSMAGTTSMGWSGDA